VAAWCAVCYEKVFFFFYKKPKKIEEKKQAQKKKDFGREKENFSNIPKKTQM